MFYRIWNGFLDAFIYIRKFYVFIPLLIVGIFFARRSLLELGAMPDKFGDLFLYYFTHPDAHISGIIECFISGAILLMLAGSQFHLANTEKEEIETWLLIVIYLFAIALLLPGATLFALGIVLLSVILLLGGVLFAFILLYAQSGNSKKRRR